MNEKLYNLPMQDRAYLENKYHRTDEPFDGFNRMAYHGYEYDPATGMTDEEIHTGLAALVKNLEGQPHSVIKAKAVEYVLEHTRIDVNEHDYFPGLYSWGRIIDTHTVNIWHGEAIDKAAAELDSRLLFDLPDSGAASYSLDFDHTVPDYDSMMELGFAGILKRAEDTFALLEHPTDAQKDFFTAVEIEYKAILRFVERLYQYALTKDFPKRDTVAAGLKQISVGAPRNTYEALLMMYLYFMISESVEHYQVRSLGYGLDGSLWSFYQKDLENGISKEEIATYISYFLMQFSAMGNYWGQPMYLGGEGKINELTYLILDIYDSLGIYNPKIQLKVNPNSPKDYVCKALDMVRHGAGNMVFCNEDTITKALMRQGATYEQATDSVIKGCYEYTTKADTICISFSTFNVLKAVALVFTGGIDKRSGQRVSTDTGDVTTFATFEEFYTAFRKQLESIVGTMTTCLGALEKQIGDINPPILYSATIPSCVKAMTHAAAGGCKTVSSMWLNGLGSAVDALMAVYELVFETKTTTLAELKTALEQNWEGYEVLRLKALNCRHKYGNGDPMADHYANAIHQHFSAQFSGLKNCMGGNYEYEIHSARAFITQGAFTEATADGRKDWEETSKNASPTQGMDKKGITALIRSATVMDLSLADSGACLDAMLHPSAVQGEDGLEAFYGVLMAYLKQGGASIHFNIFSEEMLLDAQKHPEKYKNLQVRVCGWNVLWNNMPKSEQDAYILRARNIQS